MSDRAMRHVKFQIRLEELEKFPVLYTKMLAGFLVLHVETNLGRSMITYWCRHCDAPLLDPGEEIPEGKWEIEDRQGTLQWRLWIGDRAIAHGFEIVFGRDEVQFQ